MKSAVLSLVGWIFLATSVMAQEASKPASVPVITSPSPIFDFGTVTNDPSVSHNFILKNVGDRELIIDQVKPSCGCTTASLAKKNLLPGEQVEVSATLSLKDRKGRQRKTITVTSNDPKTPRFLLQMVGSVHQEVSLLPRQAVFRYKKGADNPAREVRLRFDTPRPVQITGIVTNEAPCCSVQIKEEVPGKDYKLALKLRPDFDLPGTVQSRSAAIQILTDLPSNPKIRVPIRIQLDRNILVAPTQLTLIEGQDSSSQHLLVRDKRSRKLEVLGLQAPFDGLTYKVNSMSDSMKRLSVLIKNPTQAMNGSVLTLRIKDAEGAERELKVPVRVSGGVITN